MGPTWASRHDDRGHHVNGDHHEGEEEEETDQDLNGRHNGGDDVSH